MPLPTKDAALALLHEHVKDDYQRHHALMVATAMEGYAAQLFPRLPEGHPAQSPSASLQATPAGVTISALPRSVAEDPLLWHLTGLLHDLDYEEHPGTHPAPSLQWFKDWGYPPELIHAVEAHAYGYHGFTTLPQTKLAAALVATDELCGIFYAYRKMNSVPYGQMKPGSIRKKFKDPGFAAKIDRATIQLGCDKLGVSLDDHIANLVRFLGPLP
ncbi:hypothetical protein [Opitutus sp. GAS368]|uniref:hypothetical protein n=1 Tax=Opitutus sp. GAS368 TaxID=1882749 RepID=UPI00087BB047|nr:hypothetical protein [Opitutus sp. GAS368]SDR73644.1 Predicted hydrolase, HD superfamily [Opitutus sp. GAS368]